MRIVSVVAGQAVSQLHASSGSSVVVPRHIRVDVCARRVCVDGIFCPVEVYRWVYRLVDALVSVSVGDVGGVPTWRAAYGVGVVIFVELRGHQCVAAAAIHVGCWGLSLKPWS